MKIFLAGSTGALGSALLPLLTDSGHEVVALVRNAAKAAQVEATGATAAVADPLDRPALTAAVRSAAPEVVIHQLTALAGAGNFKKLEQEFALTNRFRTEVTDTLPGRLQRQGEAGARLAAPLPHLAARFHGGLVATRAAAITFCPRGGWIRRRTSRRGRFRT